LGRAYTKLAEWCYQQIARLDSQSARAYETLADSYRAQGRLELAIRSLQRAGLADPKLPGIHLTLAQIYLEQGKAADAGEEIEQELAIVPESVAARSLKEKITSRESKP
jgi:tetratricopeptide (TPR) repeat protein